MREFVNAAAKELGMEICWECEGANAQRYWANQTGSAQSLASGAREKPADIVKVDSRYFRPTEVETLLGDPIYAKAKLGWTPMISFDELVAKIVREDLKLAERGELIKRSGYIPMDYHE